MSEHIWQLDAFVKVNSLDWSIGDHHALMSLTSNLARLDVIQHGDILLLKAPTPKHCQGCIYSRYFTLIKL